MTQIIRSLRRDLQRAFNAFAYAHSGEMLNRTHKRRVLFGDDE
ncbi:MAG: hypothetical protein PVF75_07315 [Granulosicoccaceae bacterium]